MESDGISTQSEYYQNLEHSVQIIGSTLIPDTRDDGDYTEEEIIKIRSYRLLTHAEIEYYFEQIAKNIVTRSYEFWIENPQHCNHFLIALVNFVPIEDILSKDISQVRTEEIQFEERVKKQVNSYKKIIKANNGIRKKDMSKLLLPLGVNLDHVDALISTLDSLGGKRGAVAHCSIKANVTLDPVTEVNTIQDILQNIRIFDEIIFTNLEIGTQPLSLESGRGQEEPQ